MDELLLPDEETLEKLAEEYGKLKLKNTVTAECCTAKYCYRHRIVEDSPKLIPCATLAYKNHLHCLTLARRLLAISYGEENTDLTASVVAIKMQTSKLFYLFTDGNTKEDTQPCQPNIPYKVLSKMLLIKQTKLLLSLNNLLPLAGCSKTKRLIKQIVSAETLALYHIQAINI